MAALKCSFSANSSAVAIAASRTDYVIAQLVEQFAYSEGHGRRVLDKEYPHLFE
jgi:hypothetical protein